MKLNKLLQKQIQRYFNDDFIQQQPQLNAFIEAINESYNSYEKDIELSGHAFELSEIEYRNLNNQLTKEVKQKELSIQKLRETIASIDNKDLQTTSNNDIVDITEYLVQQLSKKKLAEAELLKTATLVTSLLQNLHSGILVENEKRQVILTNQQFCEMFSIPIAAEALIGSDCSKAAEQSKHIFKHPEEFVEKVSSVLKNKVLLKNEELELADGRFFERDYIPIYVNEEYKGHLWTYRDITDRKTTETKLKLEQEKYRNIITNMNLGLVEVDIDENIKFVNQSFCHMIGYTEQELLSTQATIFVASDKNSIKIFNQKKELRTKGISDSYEMPFYNKQGEKGWWLISGAPLYNNDNTLIGSIGIHLDITEQKLLENELKEAKIATEKSAKAKELFLTNMSHEIRTPMNAIMGMGNQLLKTSLDEQQLSFLKAINTASSNLLVIINDILDFSKIEEGKVTLEKIAFDFRTLIDDAYQVTKYKAEEKGLSITTFVHTDVASVLKGDPYRINQILLNLLSNAIKFTEKGNIDISCLVIRSNSTRQHVQIAVTDTGIGIDASFLKNIFSKFSQEDESIVRKYGGTGLGMSISKQLVELMEGTIDITSKKGMGTTVKVIFPLDKGAENDIVSIKKISASKSKLKNKKVLVVEDNEMNRFVASVILSEYEVQLFEATNGEEAIEFLNSNTVDIVLMDMRMPVMDGLEATKAIRLTISKTLPIIALTANAIKTEKEKCLAVGMNDYLAKPFKEEELLSIITKWLTIDENTETIEDVVVQVKPVEAVKEEIIECTLYSLDKIKAIGNKNTDFIAKMLSIFKIEATKAVQKISEAYTNKDIKTINETAHRIKPSLDNLAIQTLFSDIRLLEATTNLNDTNVQQAVQNLTNTLTAVIVDLEKQHTA